VYDGPVIGTPVFEGRSRIAFGFAAAVLGGLMGSWGCGSGSGATTPSSASSGGASGGASGTSGATGLAAKQIEAVHAIEEAFAKGDAKRFGQVFADDVTMNVSGRPDVHGRAAAEQGFARVLSMFGKVRYKGRRVFTKGEVAIVEYAMFGTHEGEFQGHAPTHKSVGWNAAEVDWFNPDGKIRERHVYLDPATLLAQIGAPITDGVRPPPDEPGALQHIGPGSAKEEEGNVAMLDRINAAWQGHDEAKWTALLGDQVEWEDFTIAKPAKGKDAVRAYFRIFNTAFPDAASSTINAWGIGSFVVEEGTFSGQQKGTYFNVPPTSKLATIYELNIVEIEGGKIKRGITYANELDLREQLGAVKSSPAKRK
jgi:steroid delta-isomerase-like uncharacterized protein